jgi:thioredoxin reductase (NADPH)
VTPDGYICTDRTQRTNIDRAYAAGDVTGGLRQVITACAEGATAAMSAFEDIKIPYWSTRD